jgi:hypothetical protein
MKTKNKSRNKPTDITKKTTGNKTREAGQKKDKHDSGPEEKNDLKKNSGLSTGEGEEPGDFSGTGEIYFDDDTE